MLYIDKCAILLVFFSQNMILKTILLALFICDNPILTRDTKKSTHTSMQIFIPSLSIDFVVYEKMYHG